MFFAGLTATLLNSNVKLNRVEDTLHDLEITFHATIATVDELGQVLKYVLTYCFVVYSKFNCTLIVFIQLLLWIINVFILFLATARTQYVPGTFISIYRVVVLRSLEGTFDKNLFISFSSTITLVCIGTWPNYLFYSITLILNGLVCLLECANLKNYRF